ncbi:hypothetical protein HYH03_003835 [Edaphochlamys debaryana]|uniref:EF-hand domain-containing protein n=1 Tax=Edaphochlamys debaryana TaxID=47281 RepID=A0A835Y874_9CHLO|nr:hypothetical protein HYH03_003835 [Edaphochlamys debaryana]|eukprot:KAG2498075.1 hypothetical protein HYH03_003835 [Edaphochlamys debaryana]
MLTINKTAVKVAAPPGGASSISFGGDDKPAAAPADAPVPAAETPAAEPSLESLKLAAISAVAGAEESAEARSALVAVCKALQSASSAKKVVERSAPAVDAPAAPAEAAAAQGDAAVAALKAALKLRGTHGIISIGRKFRSMDDSGDRKLSYEEFKKALVEMKLHMSEADTQRVFRGFDKDCSGYISFDELLLGLRGELTERRLDMVKRCFKVLDKDGNGTVTLADLERRYDTSRHPDVIAGTKTPRMVLMEFLGTFEAAGGGVKGDGLVDFEEFKTYYTLISSNIDEGKSGDDYFELMMRNVWHVSGGEGWCANTTCKRVLVVLEDDAQKVIELTDDFDVDVKDLAAVKAKLAEQGITGIKSVALYGDMSEASGSAPTLAGAAPPRSPAPSAGGVAAKPETPAAGASPGGGNRGRGGNPGLRSSIIFG